MDFRSEIQRIERLLEKEEYTPAATRSMIVIEQALRQVASRYLDRVDEEVKRKVQEAAQKRVRKGRGIEKLTMGQLVHVFQESEFIEAWARTSGKGLSSLKVIELKKLSQFRNEFMYHAQEATPTEAEFLLHCLKVMLETFDLSTPEVKVSEKESMEVLFRDGHALIIGVGADLPDTVTDTKGLTEILQDPERCAYPHDQVTVLTEANATRTSILMALGTLAQSTDTESTVLVYFSGHGYQVGSTTGEVYFLMPYGYNIHNLSQTAISGAEFAEKLKAIPAKKLLVLLDCCHAGGVGDAKAPIKMVKKSLPPEVLPMLSEGRGRVLIASSKDQELSYVGKPYSAFTLALLEVLCGTGVAKQDGYVRVADLALHAREVVPGRTQGRQHPILHFEHADNFVLAYYAGGETQPKALPFTVDVAQPSPPPEPVYPEQQGNAFVPGYDNDVLVSFAEVDDQPRHGAKEGWVTTLIRELKAELTRNLGTERFSLWSPHQLRRHIPKNEEIQNIQRNAATFIVILSRGYLNSDWCQNSQLGFLAMLKEMVGKGRVFLVERDHLAPDERPAEFGEMKGYQFWVEDRVGRPPRTLGDPSPQRDPGLYYERLGDLCYDLAEELWRLKKDQSVF